MRNCESTDVIYVSLIFLILQLVPQTVPGQDLDNVTISGRVVDQNTAVVPGATVEAILVRTGFARPVVTDSDGRYLIIELEPGVYKIGRAHV